MEETNEPLFGLNIDGVMKTHLTETAKWAKFLAIIGYIFTVLFVLVAIVMVSAQDELKIATEQSYGQEPGMNYGALTGPVGMVVYLLFAAMIFFPSLYMSRFAGKMKMALATNDQLLLANSLQNLRLLFRFWGIAAILVITIYILLFAAAAAGWMVGSR